MFVLMRSLSFFMRNKSGWIVTGITTFPSVSSLERFTDGVGISSLSHSIL